MTQESRAHNPPPGDAPPTLTAAAGPSTTPGKASAQGKGTFRGPKYSWAKHDLLRSLFINREDRVAHKPHKGGGCPLETDGQLDLLLWSHQLGKCGPKLTARATSRRKPEGWTVSSPFRIGTCSPALDDTSRYAMLDLDGGAHSHPLADPLQAALRVQRLCCDRGANLPPGAVEIWRRLASLAVLPRAGPGAADPARALRGHPPGPGPRRRRARQPEELRGHRALPEERQHQADPAADGGRLLASVVVRGDPPQQPIPPAGERRGGPPIRPPWKPSPPPCCLSWSASSVRLSRRPHPHPAGSPRAVRFEAPR
jgi:hypothetical protein